MSNFIKPENALKRAEELITVGQKPAALQLLHEIITKKHRVWQKSLERLMQKYIGLCVEMRKSKHAKDGLHQYKGICQQQSVNIASLEFIIKYFLEQAEEHAKVAQNKAVQISLDIDDLETEESLESLMLSSVSGEDSKERSDREIVTPWLKFLWETYRTILEILRNNSKLEHLYQETAQKAFTFCLNFKRKIEFRRLSKLLRNHLVNLTKSWSQPGATPSQESLQLHLDTRFSQLNVALGLDLTQEAFETVEDIHGLLTVSKKPPKTQVLINYYQKLSQLFWISNNLLFHAYASYKHYTLLKLSKTTAPAEITSIATSVLLAALSIPLQSQAEDERYFDFDEQKEKNMRLATLLGFTSNPKRDVLLAELTAKGFSSLVVPELSDLSHLLEEKFHPLEICSAVKPKLEFIQANLGLQQYSRRIEKLLFVRYLQQLSKVYQTVTLAQLRKQASFTTPIDIEKWMVEAVKGKLVDIRIDHQNGAIHFGSQTLESQSMRTQLSSLAKNLQLAVEMIHPEIKSDRHTKKAEAFKRILQTIQEEHQKVLARKVIIEKRKERAELIERTKTEEEDKANKIIKQEADEKERIERARQAKINELALKDQQDKEKKKVAAEKMLAELVKTAKATNNPAMIRRIQQQIGDSGTADASVRAELLEVSKKEAEKKLKRAARRLDHLERARREAEKPLLVAQLNEQKQKDKGFYEEKIQKFLEAHRVAHAQQVVEKKRLDRMDSARADFEKRIQERIDTEFNAKKSERDATLAHLRAKLYAEKEKRQQEEATRRAEEERVRAIQEEERRRRLEEEERVHREEEERKRAEQERIAAANLIAEKQRKREEEALLRQQEEAQNWRKPRPTEDKWGRRQEEAPEPRRDVDRRRDEERKPEPDRWRREDRRDEPRREEPRREEPKREEGGWRRDDRREPPRRDEPRRDEPRREESRREEPRREEGGWRDRREPARREEPRREEPKREEPRREEGDRWGRRDEGRRDEPRREEPRRDEGRREEPRRDEGRREDPRRRDEGPRRDEGRRDEPRRRDEADSWRGARDEPARAGFGGNRGSDRGGADRGGRDAWRRDDRDDRGGRERDNRREERGDRGDRGGDRGGRFGGGDREDNWRARRGGAAGESTTSSTSTSASASDAEPRAAPQRPTQAAPPVDDDHDDEPEVSADGFQTVKKGRKKPAGAR